MREELIPKSNFRVGVKAADWEEAVRAAGQILLDNGSIEQKYIEDMIQAAHDLGPYMAIMPKFALAHADPCAAVLRNDMSLILLETPVEFGCENDPISIILCVACTDRDSHREVLTKVAEALMDDEIYDRLAEARTVDEAYEILHTETA